MFRNLKLLLVSRAAASSSCPDTSDAIQVGVSGVTHAPNRQFGPVVEAALAMPGFTGDEDFSKEAALPPFTVGFGHGTVLSVAGDVLDAVKAGKLEHVFLIGGCVVGAETRPFGWGMHIHYACIYRCI